MRKYSSGISNYDLIQQRNHSYHWQTSQVLTYLCNFTFIFLVILNKLSINIHGRTTHVHQLQSMVGYEYMSLAKLNKSILWESILYKEFTMKSIMLLLSAIVHYTFFRSVKLITYVCIYTHTFLSESLVKHLLVHHFYHPIFNCLSFTFTSTVWCFAPECKSFEVPNIGQLKYCCQPLSSFN